MRAPHLGSDTRLVRRPSGCKTASVHVSAILRKLRVGTSTEVALAVGDRELSMDLQHWVNDGLMVFFFYVVGLEIRRELALGELRDRREAAVPALAALGGMVVPALLFLAINAGGDGARVPHGAAVAGHLGAPDPADLGGRQAVAGEPVVHAGGGGVARGAVVEDEDPPAGPGEVQGGGQSGGAATDHDHVVGGHVDESGPATRLLANLVAEVANWEV